jgi:hypothetical protein
MFSHELGSDVGKISCFCIFHKIHHRHKSTPATLFASWYYCWRVLSLLAATTTLCILDEAATTTMAHILTAVAGECAD